MLRKYTIQVLSQAALSCASFSIPLIAITLGANYVEVGLVVAAYGFAQFASGLVFGRAADMHGRRRLLRWGLGVSAVAVLLNLVARSPLELILSRGLFGVAAGIFPAALTALAYDENRRLGKFQSFGSLGFSVGVLGGGLIALRWHDGVFVAASALLALAFLVSLSMYNAPETHVKVPAFPREVIGRNLPAYVAVVLRHIGAAAVWALFPVYLVQMGADVFFVALVSFVNGLFQFLLMPRMDRFPSRALVIAGLALSALTFALIALAPNLWWLLAAMPVLAASWSCLYMGALKFVLERNVERATSTAYLQSTIQVSSMVGPLFGGLVAATWGDLAPMVLAVALSLVAIPVFLYELARHPAKIIEDDRPVPVPPRAALVKELGGK